MVTLEVLLRSRDARVARQRELLEAHPGLSLLCLTVQLPGQVKRNKVSLKIAESGVEAVRAAFSVEYEELLDLDTGYEGYFLVPDLPLEAKRIACDIEDTHPLGRLMDIDVITFAGGGKSPCHPERSEGSQILTSPLGREELGLPPRKCLLCDRPARECMRARTHSTKELLAKIEEMVNDYSNL